MNYLFSKLLTILIIVYSLQACPDECAQCQSDNKTCTACIDNFQRTIDGSCIKPLIQNCILFGSNQICYKCKPSFKISNNQCIKQLSGCSKYGTNNKCSQCGFGTQLSNEACVGILNCKIINNQSICQQCNSNYKLQNNICKSMQSDCSQVDKKLGACLKCAQGSKLIGYQCVPDYIEPQFCYIYDQNGQCIYCKQGFTNLQGSCYTSGEIQKIYKGQIVRSRKLIKSVTSNDKNETSTATNNSNSGNPINNNSQGSSGSSQGNNSNPNYSTQKPQNPIQRCARYDDTLTKCLLCQTNYTLVQQGCYYQIQGCVSYQVIAKSVLCKQCSQKYQLQPNTKVCLLKKSQTVANCLIPSLSKLSCIVCNQGFTQNNGQCIKQSVQSQTPQKNNCQTFDQSTKKCKSCSSLYDLRLQNGMCLQSLCLKFNSIIRNQCQACKDGYQLNSKGICQFSDKNCQQVVSNKCAKCFNKYFITNDGLCAVTPYGCQIPNAKTLTCSICLKDYLLLSNGTCRQQSPIDNCQTLQTNQNSINKCAVCIEGFYPSYDLCKKVSERCNGYDKDTGSCLACKQPFSFNKGKCLDPDCLIQSSQTLDFCDKCKQTFSFKNGQCRFSDPNCQLIQGTSCQQCFEGYVFSNAKGVCTLISSNQSSSITQKNNSSVINSQNTNNTKPPISNNSSTTNPLKVVIQGCIKYNQLNPKYCLQCQSQYVLAGDLTKCNYNKSSTETPIQKDSNCQTYDKNEFTKCVKCNDRYFMNSLTNKCSQVNQLCNDYDVSNGACLNCFEGFYLQNGRCFVKVQIDQYCIQKAVVGCSKCVDGYFIDKTKNGTCQKFNAFCATWNYNNGNCNSCNDGYTLVQGQCINLADDPNCIYYYTPDKKYCQKCTDNFFVNSISGKCQKINDNCKTYNPVTGQCYTCKDGYKISKSLCEKTINIQNYVEDYYCKTKSNTTNLCVQCFNGYYLSLQNVCKQKNPICKQVSRQNGDCTQCYNGYFLSLGACIVPSNLYVNNMTFSKNCKVFVSNMTDSCKQCYPGFRLAGQICLQVNQLCKQFDNKNGLCTSCYEGYYLQGGNCLIDLGNNPNELDPFCIQLSKDFSNCIKCAPGYFIGNDGYCQAFNSSFQCQSYSPTTGKCLSCSYGFILSKLQICIQETKYCTQYDQNDICVQCITGYFVKDTICFPRDIKCEIYDAKSGNCNKCISNYVLFKNQCILPSFGFDRFCSNYVNSYCTQCLEGSYMFNYRCRQIDSNCIKFDYANKRCISCKGGMTVKGINCVAQN